MLFKANRKPRLPNPRIYPYWRWSCWWAAALHYQYYVTGEHNIPAPEGETRGRNYYPKLFDPFSDEPVDTHGFVLAPNHKSLLDIVIVGFFLRPFILIGKPFFRMMPGVNVFFDANGLLTVFRPGEDDIMKHWWARPFKFIIVPWRRLVSLRSEEMIALAIRAAKLGIPIEIYPEGTRDKLGTGGKGRLGAIQIAMDAGVPLLPAGIYYGGHKGLLHRRQVAMVIGEPMALPRCTFAELSYNQRVALADRWQEEVRVLREQAKQLIEG